MSATAPRRAEQGPHRGGAVTVLLVVVLLVAVLLVVAGSQARDRGVVDAAGYDRVAGRFQSWFLAERDEQGTSWSHWRLQTGAGPALRSSAEVDYVRVGQGGQRATVTSQRLDTPGLSLDVVHPSGSDTDLVLVGDRYRRAATPGEAGPRAPLVSTPWIARPTRGAGGTWSPCITSATRTFCDLDRAAARSRDAVAGLPRWVRDNPDGTRSAVTGIRLVDLFAMGGDPLDDRQLARVVPLLGQQLVPFTVTESGTGQFLSARLAGRLAAPGLSVELDVGLEHRGPAGVEDVPRGPSDPREITVMDELRYLRFSADAALRARTA